MQEAGGGWDEDICDVGGQMCRDGSNGQIAASANCLLRLALEGGSGEAVGW